MKSGLKWWQLFTEIPRRENDPLGTIRRWHALYGPRVRIPIRSPASWSLTDPEDIRHVLITNSQNYRKVGWLTIGRRFLGDGLLTSAGELHHHQRTILQPAFHRSRIQGFADIIVEETDRRTSGWQDGQDINISGEMARLTLATVGRSFFGRTFDDVAEDLLEAFLTCQHFMARLASFLPDSVPTPRTVRYRKATKRIDEIVNELLSATGADHHLLDLLRTARGINQKPLSRQLIRDEIVTILWAGHETACNALEWGWHILSQHPEVWKQLHDEIGQVLGGTRPSIDHVADLKFTDLIFAEILRMYPPAWILARWAIGEDSLRSGLKLPKGSIIFISPYAVHHDPRWFKDPDRFDPERFNSANRASRPPLSYLPFGAGPRVCIGEHFGRLEGVLILARIAQQFTFIPISGQAITPQPLLTLRMKHDLHLTVKRRIVRTSTTPCLRTTAS